MGSEQFGRLNMMAMLRTLIDAEVVIVPNVGAPISGSAGTGVGHFGSGSLLIDITTGDLYSNVGQKSNPTWELHETGSGGLTGLNVKPIPTQNVDAGIITIHRDSFDGGTSFGPLLYDEKVIDIWITVNQGSIVGTVNVQNSDGDANIISSTINTNQTINDLLRAGGIISSNATILAGNSINVGLTGTPTGEIFIETIRV